MTEELKQAISALQCAKRGHCDHAMADEAIAALEALTQRPAAQAGEREAFEAHYSEQLTKAKRLLVELHKIGGEDVRTMIEARTGPWFVWDQGRASLPTQPAFTLLRNGDVLWNCSPEEAYLAGIRYAEKFYGITKDPSFD